MSEESPLWGRNPVAGPPGYPAMSRFKALFPLGPARVGRAAQAGHRDPNPAEDLSVPTHHALATPEGIQAWTETYNAGLRVDAERPLALPRARTSRASKPPVARRKLAQRFGTTHRIQKRRAIVSTGAVSQRVAQHGSVERNQAALNGEEALQDREIAIPDERLARAPYFLGVEQRQHLRAAVATAHADETVN